MLKQLGILLAIFQFSTAAWALEHCYGVANAPYVFQACMNRNMDELKLDACYGLANAPYGYQACMNRNMDILGLERCYGAANSPYIFENCLNRNIDHVAGERESYSVFNFSGKVTEIQDENTLLENKIAVGDVVQVQIEMNRNFTADEDSSSRRSYHFNNRGDKISIQIQNEKFSTWAAHENMSVEVANNTLSSAEDGVTDKMDYISLDSFENEFSVPSGAHDISNYPEAFVNTHISFFGHDATAELLSWLDLWPAMSLLSWDQSDYSLRRGGLEIFYQDLQDRYYQINIQLQ